MPGTGQGTTWWMIDVLGFDESFQAKLALVAYALTLFGMFALRGYMARNSIASIIVMLTVAGTLISLPNIGMFYGLHEWTARHTGGLAFTAMTGIPTPDQVGAVVGTIKGIFEDPAKLATKDNFDKAVEGVQELIKPGGENVYPAEVETVIVQMEGVTGACVIGVPDTRWGEAVKAVVEVKPEGRYTAEQVSDFVGSRIARFKRPHMVAFTDALPRAADGSVDREAVKTRWGTR